MDNGITAHYEFNDASCSSRQQVSDFWANTHFTIEYVKEIEQQQDDTYISTWEAAIRISALNNSKPIGAFPVFFVAKEGKDGSEDDFLSVSQLDKNSNFYRINHRVSNDVHETFEFGTLTPNMTVTGATKNRMVGLRVP